MATSKTCHWVTTGDEDNLVVDPEGTLEEAESATRCVRDAIVGFADGGATYYACQKHAPAHHLDKIGIEDPTASKEGRDWASKSSNF